MANNSKNAAVEIDITADPQELKPELQKAEKTINTFGQKVTNIFKNISQKAGEIKNSIKDSFEKSTKHVKNFIDQLKISEKLLSALNKTWLKSRQLLSSYLIQLNLAIGSHKTLNRVNRLTAESSGYATTKLIEYAHYLEKVTRYNHLATEGAMQMIMQFRNIHGQEFIGATKAAQDLASELKIDLSAAALKVGQALNDPISAIDELAEINIYFTKKQKEAIKTFVEEGKVVSAQNIILGKLAKAYGGAAKAAGETFAGRMERLKNVLTQIGTNIGERVIQKLQKLAGGANNGSKAFDNFLVKIEEWGNIAAAVVDSITDKIIQFAKFAQNNFQTFYTWLLTTSIEVFSAIQTAYQLAGTVLHQVGVFIYNSFISVWKGIKIIFTDIMPKAFTYLTEVFLNFCNQFVFNLKILALNMGVLWGQIKNDAAQGLIEIKGFFIKAAIEIATRAMNLVTSFFFFWRQFVPGLAFVINHGTNRVKDYIQELVDEQTKAEKALKAQERPVFLEFEKFKNPFKEVEFPDFGESIDDLKEAFDLSEEWGDLLTDINDEFGKGFRKNVRENMDAFNDFTDDIKDRLKDAKEEFDKNIKEPEMIANKRMEDEKKEREKESNKFHSGLTGLEELWVKMSSGESPEVKATEANTKAVQEQTKELKRKSLEEREREHEHQQRMRKAAHENELARRKGIQKEPETPEEKAARIRDNQIKRANANEARLKESQRKFERELGLKPGEGADLFEEHRAIRSHLRQNAQNFKSVERAKEAQRKRDALHNQLEDRRNAKKDASREFEKQIRARMAQTGESYGKARRALELVKEGRNVPANEMARQKANSAEARQLAVRQHDEQAKHLRSIATNTRNAAKEAKETKQQTALVVKNTKTRNIV